MRRRQSARAGSVVAFVIKLSVRFDIFLLNLAVFPRRREKRLQSVFPGAQGVAAHQL